MKLLKKLKEFTISRKQIANQQIAIIDDYIPNAKPMGFRNYEFNLILKAIPEAHIWTMSKTKPGKDAFFTHSYGQDKKQFEKNLDEYLKFHPENKDRVHWLNTKKKHSFGLAYSIFLCTTYTLLPFYEKNKIPFIFVLYPGGGFGLDNPSSDKMLKAVCQSPYFKGVICTQPVTYDYLIKKQFCKPEQIHYEFGGYIQFQPQDIPEKKYYPNDKKTLDICFVAAKYSPKGIDKGYDLFIDTAKELVKKYSFVHFHVVGGFDETDIPIDALKDKITFYGYLQPAQLSELYSKMDICLSPNRPFKLFPGNFDGFPLSSEAMCFKTVLATTDELNNNRGYYIDGKELIIIRPNLKDILSKIEPLLENTERLYSIGHSGAIKTFDIKNPQKRAENIIEFLRKNINIKTPSLKDSLQTILPEKTVANPKLSICCITYNHAKFIRQALDGFVMQKTNFPFEIIIHDDASTDGTADIIREYEQKYPDIIRATYQSENQWSKGVNVLKTFVYPKIQGQYVALCEGDDYWTDENKLQKQVDYLDAHPEMSICFHPVKVIWEDKSQSEYIFPTVSDRFNKNVLTLEDLLKRNFIQTNSVVYRWCLKGIENTLPDGILPIDYYMHLRHAQTGKIGFLVNVMAVYRRHAGGIWTGAGVTDDWFLKCAIPHLKFYQEVEQQFNTDKSADIEHMMRQATDIFIRHQEWDKLKQMLMIFPEKFVKIITIDNYIGDPEKYFKKYKKYYKITKILIGIIIVLAICLILK